MAYASVELSFLNGFKFWPQFNWDTAYDLCQRDFCPCFVYKTNMGRQKTTCQTHQSSCHHFITKVLTHLAHVNEESHHDDMYSAVLLQLQQTNKQTRDHIYTAIYAYGMHMHHVVISNRAINILGHLNFHHHQEKLDMMQATATAAMYKKNKNKQFSA